MVSNRKMEGRPGGEQQVRKDVTQKEGNSGEGAGKTERLR
jgi:hypothetical protein